MNGFKKIYFYKKEKDLIENFYRTLIEKKENILTGYVLLVGGLDSFVTCSRLINFLRQKMGA